MAYGDFLGLLNLMVIGPGSKVRAGPIAGGVGEKVLIGRNGVRLRLSQ